VKRVFSSRNPVNPTARESNHKNQDLNCRRGTDCSHRNRSFDKDSGIYLNGLRLQKSADGRDGGCVLESHHLRKQ
jgi:hypothetical protein